MKRLYLTVEGQTEQAFCTQVLAPHLADFGVQIVKPRLTGLHGRKGTRIPRGGLLDTFGHAQRDIARWLKEDQSRNARFSMMVDLYGLPKDFPGYEEAQHVQDPLEKARKLEQALKAKLHDQRFIPYLSVHEFEALVLADPEEFACYFSNRDVDIEGLIGECQSYDSPELINDGQQSHPKARIRRHLPDYDENVDGPLLSLSIGLRRIRNQCKHFDEWLTLLECLDSSNAV